ncbi:MAG: hypothetical protein M3044_03955 [Thermoproteota archaeon]|nr:hypothetical protein [Thermoproteota archaeon]
MTNLIRYRVDIMYYPCNNQLMETIRSDKCSVVHDDFDVSSNTLKYENNLMHEHDFVQVTAKGVDNFLICCITCGSYYCNICGKLLENEVTPSGLASEEAILVGE